MEQTKIPGRYRLIEEVGQGGMAVVFRAQDETLKREVAVKLLHHHLATDVESKARLEREAQAVAKLRHVNILEIFDYSGATEDSAYIVTEFIDGKTLKQLFEHRRIRHPEVAAMIAAEIGGALAHAHGVGIIHRDVKPENVMIRKDGLLKLMDFGIAQVVDLQRMTVTGQLLGSPSYMAPELIEGKPLDFRTDVFSVGIILYQMATGSLPFAGKNPHEVLRRIGEGKYPDPRTLNRLIGDGLARVIRHALARNPDDRYPDVSQFVDDLRENLADAGLTDTRAELRAFFADADAYETALAPRLSAALLASSQTHLSAGKASRALELWNRVLAIDPQNREVLAALRRFNRRGLVRRVGLVAMAVAAVGAAWTLIPHRARVRPVAPAPLGATRATSTPTAPAAAAPASTTPTPAGEPPRPPERSAGTSTPTTPAERPNRRGPSGHAARAQGRATADATQGSAVPVAGDVEMGIPTGGIRAANTAPRALIERVFTLGPTPQNVDVYLDGDRKFAYDTDHKTISVPWNGNHVIELRSPAGCCFSERIDVGPDRPLPPDNIIARKLKWKPARVTIMTEPAAPRARVFVKDPSARAAGTPAKVGDDVSIPFQPSDERTKEVEVDVDTGDTFTSQRITVHAGEQSSHMIKLVKPRN